MSGLASAWSDFKETFFPSVAYAEEDDEDTQEESTNDTQNEESQDEESQDEESQDEESKDEESKGDDSEEGGDDSEEGDDEDEDEDEDDEDDEDEDELVDPLDSLREKYTNTVCHGFKHHFDECVERVTAAQEEPDYEDREYKEDCIEEFFHLQHCLNDNIAPVLFAKLR